MLTKKGAKVLQIIGIVLASILVVGCTAAVIYQMTGGSLADVWGNFIALFTTPAA